MVRRIIATIAGTAVAVVVVMLVQKVGHNLYPPPAGMDPSDQEFMKNYVASLPWGPLTFVIASYTLATLIGGWLAAMVAGERALLFAGIVALFMLAAAGLTMYMIPHPMWFMIASVSGIVVAAILAAVFASKHGGSSRAV